jgi:serine/threonine protein kinase
MTYNLVKTGGCSIIIGEGHFNQFIQSRDNKLVKVTKIVKNHNEFKHLDKVRRINKYKEYYSIPDEEVYMLSPNNDFYEHVKRLAKLDNLNIFQGIVQYVYIDYGGDIDLHDSISETINSGQLTFWKSYKVIDKLVHQLLKGLSFLHDKQIAHLDIKPENIMINTTNCTFKIIDFGFCSYEPFDEFVNEPRGTPGYFPKYYSKEKIEPWLPKVEANDFIYHGKGRYPGYSDRTLIYKIDSYCLGRVLYFLKYIYDDNKVYYCYNGESRLGERLDGIIEVLLENNVYKRIKVKECLDLYF